MEDNTTTNNGEKIIEKLESIENDKEKDVQEKENSCTEEEEEYYPDGGFRAYSVVFGSFMGIFPIWGMTNAFGILEEHISKNQLVHEKASTISWIFSLHLTTTAACCVLSGAYFDRNGGRAPVIVGSLMYVVGFFTISFAKQVWHFILTFSLLCGCGAGVLMTPLISCVATWFNKKRAMATGMASVGGSVGGIFIPLLLKVLYESVGFKAGMQIVSGIFLAFFSVATVLARERGIQKPQPFQDYKVAAKFYLRTCFNWRYFLEPAFLWCTISFALAENSICVASTYLSSYIIKRGYGSSMSYTILTVSSAFGIPGRYIAGYLADNCFGRFNVVIASCFLATAVNLLMWYGFGQSKSVMWAYACIYGFLVGSVFSLTPVCIGQISRTRDFGKRYSTSYLLNAIIIAPLIPIGGVILDHGSITNYNNLILYTAALMFAGGLCYVLSRTYAIGWKLSVF